MLDKCEFIEYGGHQGDYMDKWLKIVKKESSGIYFRKTLDLKN